MEKRIIDKDNDSDLFKAVLGGYGQFGVIIEIELETALNTMLKFHAEYMNPKYFAKEYQKKITENPKAELSYGRLSVDKNELFNEAGLFWYEYTDKKSIPVIQAESSIALKRALFRISQYANIGKKIRWSSEKYYAKLRKLSPPISSNTAMNTDIHILWPLYGDSKDVLHEYFVPKNKVSDFLSSLKYLVLKYNMNIMNVTIREVNKDNLTKLPYAQKDVFGFVLLFVQKNNNQGEIKMKDFTQQLIDEVLKLGGSFYLPYRTHYTKKQFIQSYPNFKEWLMLKQKWNGDRLFDSQFSQYIDNILQP